MSEAPPPKILPTWNAATMVEPNAKLSGSTSVACWLVELVNVSVLSLTSGTVAGGKADIGFDDPDPHPAAARTIAAKEISAALRKFLNPATLTRLLLPVLALVQSYRGQRFWSMQ